MFRRTVATVINEQASLVGKVDRADVYEAADLVVALLAFESRIDVARLDRLAAMHPRLLGAAASVDAGRSDSTAPGQQRTVHARARGRSRREVDDRQAGAMFWLCRNRLPGS